MRIHDYLTLVALAQINPHGFIYTDSKESGRAWFDHAGCYANSIIEEDREVIFGNPEQWVVETVNVGNLRCSYCKGYHRELWLEDVCASTIG